MHLHSTHSVAVSCLAEIDPDDVLPPITAYYVMRVGRLPLVPYFQPGDMALAEAVRGFAGKHHAVLLANHGPVVAGLEPRRRGQRDRGTRGDRQALSAAARRQDPLSDAGAGSGAAVMTQRLPGAPSPALPPRCRFSAYRPGARPAEPIRIGFSMALTGGRSRSVGKTGLLAIQDLGRGDQRQGRAARPAGQARLLRRPEQSGARARHLYKADRHRQGRSARCPATRTNLVVPAMPVMIQHNRLFFGLFALGANDEFHYPKYFSMLVVRPGPGEDILRGLFRAGDGAEPKAEDGWRSSRADAEFRRKATDSARDNAKAAGLKIVYDRAYPPNTVDFTPIIRAVQAASPTSSIVASYPPDTVGILRAVSEIGLEDQDARRRAGRAGDGGDEAAARRRS